MRVFWQNSCLPTGTFSEIIIVKLLFLRVSSAKCFLIKDTFLFPRQQWCYFLFSKCIVILCRELSPYVPHLRILKVATTSRQVSPINSSRITNQEWEMENHNAEHSFSALTGPVIKLRKRPRFTLCAYVCELEPGVCR